MPACTEGAGVKEPITQRERNEKDPQRPSQLFLLRVWIDRKRDSQASEDLAGNVQDPVSGQVQYFSGGMELVRVLRHLISRKEVNRPGKHREDGQL